MYLANKPAQFTGVMPITTSHSGFRDADYLASMCHEIGTPLTAIIGLSHVLAKVECSPEEKKRCAEMLNDSALTLLGLMNSMLDSSKMEAGMIEIENIELDLRKVFQEAVNIIAIKAAEKNLDLRMQVSDDVPPKSMGDPLRLRQVLLNLLSNAVKFTYAGFVTLYADMQVDKRGNDVLSITVADTGCGMSKESLGRIFGRYVQADSSVSRKHGGTGLGLSISRELTHLMGGEIAVKSWPGFGSHFIVTLPLPSASSLLLAA